MDDPNNYLCSSLLPEEMFWAGIRRLEQDAWKQTTQEKYCIQQYFPTAPQNKVAESKKIVLDIIKKYNVSLISLGNGTASRESEAVIIDIIKECPTQVEYYCK